MTDDPLWNPPCKRVLIQHPDHELLDAAALGLDPGALAPLLTASTTSLGTLVNSTSMEGEKV